MRAIIQRGTVAFALLAFAGAAALFIPIGVAEETTGRNTLGVIQNTAPNTGPALSLEDESRIFQHVLRVPNAPVADIELPEPTAAVPRSVPLQDLPAAATRDVPNATGYKFVKLEDWVLLVSPTTRMVVAQIPRYKLMQ